MDQFSRLLLQTGSVSPTSSPNECLSQYVWTIHGHSLWVTHHATAPMTKVRPGNFIPEGCSWQHIPNPCANAAPIHLALDLLLTKILHDENGHCWGRLAISSSSTSLEAYSLLPALGFLVSPGPQSLPLETSSFKAT